MAKAEYEDLPVKTAPSTAKYRVFRGCILTTETLEECRTELEEVLEEWLLFSISRNLDVPVVDGIDINVQVTA